MNIIYIENNRVDFVHNVKSMIYHEDSQEIVLLTENIEKFSFDNISRKNFETIKDLVSSSYVTIYIHSDEVKINENKIETNVWIDGGYD